MAKLLEGKFLAEKIKEVLKNEIAEIKRKILTPPLLASIEIRGDAAVSLYGKAQAKTAEELGIRYRPYAFDKDISEKELIDLIQKLNHDASVNGIMVQMPLPPHIDYKKIIAHIDIDKDVEGLHPGNVGKIMFGNARLIPCTAGAAMALIESAGVDLYGADVVIVGHSEIIGKPLSLLLLDKFATVTVCHIATSKAGRLEEYVKKAQVVIVAVGKAGLIKGAWIKKNAVVIDVGINRVGGKIVGDVEFQEAAKRASWITPVPGGVGPLTVTMLMRNLVEAMKLQIEKDSA